MGRFSGCARGSAKLLRLEVAREAPRWLVQVAFNFGICPARVHHDGPRQSVVAVHKKAGSAGEAAGMGAVSGKALA
jgi:hypothetical protein